MRPLATTVGSPSRKHRMPGRAAARPALWLAGWAVLAAAAAGAQAPKPPRTEAKPGVTKAKPAKPGAAEVTKPAAKTPAAKNPVKPVPDTAAKPAPTKPVTPPTAAVPAPTKPVTPPAAAVPAPPAARPGFRPGPPPPAGKEIVYAVNGTVLSPAGKAVPGARVWLAWAGRLLDRNAVEAQADARGRFRLAQAVTDARFLAVGAAAPGSGPTWQRLATRASNPPVELQLPAPVSLTGRIAKSDGSGAARIRLAVAQLVPEPSGPEDDIGQYADVATPKSLLRGLVTHTGPDGRFRFSGLPPGGQVILQAPEDLPLTEGSAAAVRLGTAPVQDAGFLVVSHPGAFEVLVQTPAGMPLPGVGVRIRRVVPTPASELAETFSRPIQELFNSRAGTIEVDPKGAIRLDNLQPGRYEMAVRGLVQSVGVVEGAITGPVKLVVRTDPFTGRVVGADGKPASAASVEVDLVRSDWQVSPLNPARTGEDGLFQMTDFPWGARDVVVRARLGNALGEWRGDPATLTLPLSLPLKADALVKVQGRALGPAGKPLAGVNLVLIEADSERPLATTQADAQGRFDFPSLRRGLRFTLNAVEARRPFVSGLRETPASGPSLDLGDLRLEAGKDPGLQSLAALTEAFSLTPVPAAADMEAGRALAWDYLLALRAGEFKKLRAMTSTAAPSYDRELASFMRKEAFSLPPEAGALKREALRAVPILPRLTFALLFGLEPDQRHPERTLDALSRSDWLAIGYPAAQGVNVLLVAHRDGDGWKAFGGIRSDAAALTTAPDDQTLFGLPARPAPEEPVLRVARAYLGEWSFGKMEAMRRLTNPEAVEYGGGLEAYKKAFQARPDRGTAPRGAGEAALGLDPRFSRWDQAMLLVYPRMLADVRAGRPSPARTLVDFPFPQVKAGGVAVVHYEAGGKQYLMLLVRRAGTWEVLEPALPA